MAAFGPPIYRAMLKVNPQERAMARFRAAQARFQTVSKMRNVIVRSAAASALYDSTGPEFEVRVARIFRKWGYEVREMGGSNDGGVDLVVRRGDEHALVQCKAHGKSVGPAVVRELYGALTHSNANYAYLVTLHGVSASASDWIKDKPISVLKASDLTLDRMPLRIEAAAKRRQQ